MYTLYSISVYTVGLVLKLIANFNSKIKLFVEGRKNVFTILKESITENDKVIWMHVASLGEYEQGLPILEKLKATYPNHKTLVTFFSPSGYEVKKHTCIADITTYLPLDTKKNALQFLKLAHPEMALFIKYEIWPNYLNELHKGQTPTFLVSALFSKKQVYFKWYGGFMRKSLETFKHIFVQDIPSEKLLNAQGFKNVSISGDTRFDRVSEISKKDNALSFMKLFKGDEICFVIGSSWPEDEAVILDFINTTSEKIKYVIAPHTIKASQINKLKEAITKKTLLYSEIQNKNIVDYDVLLLDTIGLLTKAYSYADIAYVGGGFKTGLHNTLEPAVYGVPILIGPNYTKFKEAKDLVAKKGIIPIHNTTEFQTTLETFIVNKEMRAETGQINATYINENIGATTIIIQYLTDYFKV